MGLGACRIRQTTSTTDAAHLMSRVTLGQLLLDTAEGEKSERIVSDKTMREVGQGIMQRAQREIDDVRKQQRKALEERRASVASKRHTR